MLPGDCASSLGGSRKKRRAGYERQTMGNEGKADRQREKINNAWKRNGTERET